MIATVRITHGDYVRSLHGTDSRGKSYPSFAQDIPASRQALAYNEEIPINISHIQRAVSPPYRLEIARNAKCTVMRKCFGWETRMALLTKIGHCVE